MRKIKKQVEHVCLHCGTTYGGKTTIMLPDGSTVQLGHRGTRCFCGGPLQRKVRRIDVKTEKEVKKR